METMTATATATTPAIVCARLGTDKSLRQISRDCGLTISHVSRLFNGKRRLTLRVARLLSTALSVPLDTVVSAFDEPSQIAA